MSSSSVGALGSSAAISSCASAFMLGVAGRGHLARLRQLALRRCWYSRKRVDERLHFGQRLGVRAVGRRIGLHGRIADEPRQLVVARRRRISVSQNLRCHGDHRISGAASGNRAAETPPRRLRSTGASSSAQSLRSRRTRRAPLERLAAPGCAARPAPATRRATVAPAGTSHVELRARRRAREAARTTAPSRACPLQRSPPRVRVVGVGRRALRPTRRRPRRTRASRPARSASRVRSRSGTPETPRARCARGRDDRRRWPRRFEPADAMVHGQEHARPAARATLAAIRSNTFSASGSNASYSRCRTRRPWCVARTTPTNAQTRRSLRPRPRAAPLERRRERSTASGSRRMARHCRQHISFSIPASVREVLAAARGRGRGRGACAIARVT